MLLKQKKENYKKTIHMRCFKRPLFQTSAVENLQANLYLQNLTSFSKFCLKTIKTTSDIMEGLDAADYDSNDE